MGASYLFVGPDKTFTGIGLNLAVMLASQAFMGFGAGFLYIPSVPLLNEILETYYPKQKTQTANTASALFTSGMSLGQLVGPIISGNLAEHFGFAHSCSYLGFALMLLGVSYTCMFCYKFKEVEDHRGSVVLIRSDANSLDPKYADYLFKDKHEE